MPRSSKKPFTPPKHDFKVGSRFRISKASTEPPKGAPSGKKGRPKNEAILAEHVSEIYELQRRLYADNTRSLLLVFQAMDAAGKDGTIRAVMTGINPAGCEVTSFKRPSSEELDHDFLWRASKALPQRGRIGVFNRSHYEEVLVVRVFPKILEHQRLPRVSDDVWEERFESINEFEHHLARNGTTILKFFLHVSKEEQTKRLLERIDDPRKNWKFESGDLDMRDHWDSFMGAYEKTLRETSKPWAPWYCIPADDKRYMRRTVAEIVRDTLKAMKPEYPKMSDEEKARLSEYRKRLLAQR